MVWLIGAERWPWAGAGQRWGRGQVAVACFAARSGPWMASGKTMGPSLAPPQVSADWGSAQGQGGRGVWGWIQNPLQGESLP